MEECPEWANSVIVAWILRWQSGERSGYTYMVRENNLRATEVKTGFTVGMFLLSTKAFWNICLKHVSRTLSLVSVLSVPGSDSILT